MRGVCEGLLENGDTRVASLRSLSVLGARIGLRVCKSEEDKTGSDRGPIYNVVVGLSYLSRRLTEG